VKDLYLWWGLLPTYNGTGEQSNSACAGWRQIRRRHYQILVQRAQIKTKDSVEYSMLVSETGK
jgi:hypothetical protein